MMTPCLRPGRIFCTGWNMPSETPSFSVRSSVWLVDAAGNVVFGIGRMRILEAIRRTGSISAAARDLGMGYRAVWGRIRATEERLGASLLVKNIGGTNGGGSSLTPFALELMDRFRDIHHEVMHAADAAFDEGIKPFLLEKSEK